MEAGAVLTLLVVVRELLRVGLDRIAELLLLLLRKLVVHKFGLRCHYPLLRGEFLNELLGGLEFIILESLRRGLQVGLFIRGHH